MDASSSDLSLPQGKRKAETLSQADSVTEDEEEEKGSSESDQVWGFDSFEGSDYESPEDDDDECEFRRYERHYHESQGFKVHKEMVPKDLFQ